MLDAALDQVAQHLDAGMRMRLVADAARARAAVVVDEDERPDRWAVRRGQGAMEQHVAVVDDALRCQAGFDPAVHSRVCSRICLRFSMSRDEGPVECNTLLLAKAPGQGHAQRVELIFAAETC